MKSPRSLVRDGFEVVEELFGSRLLAALRQEALARWPQAVTCEVTKGDGAEWRGGSPERRFASAGGGEVQRSIFSSPDMLAFLRSRSGTSVRPSGAFGTYSYYARAGDHLAVHRDVDTCDLAVITCLCDSGGDASAGALCTYPSRRDEPLSAIRKTPRRGALLVRLAPAQTIVLFGGIVPHALLPVDADQARIVSVLCYVADASRLNGSQAD